VRSRPGERAATASGSANRWWLLGIAAIAVGGCGTRPKPNPGDASVDGPTVDGQSLGDTATDGASDDRGDAAPAACDPDAMPQPNAGLVEAITAEGCPGGMIVILGSPPFCVDRYEAALVLQSDGSPWSPYLNPGSTPVRAVSLAGAVPQSNISGTQSAAACAAAGKRLCTDAEWRRVCQGPQGTTYPYGDTRLPGVCNDARVVNPVVQYFGSNDPSVFAMAADPCIDQQPGTLARTGAYAGCVTADGAFDMMGNLDEWTADPAGTFRGGDYVDTALNGDGCLYVTTAHDASYADYSTGFRCCF